VAGRRSPAVGDGLADPTATTTGHAGADHDAPAVGNRLARRAGTTAAPRRPGATARR